MAESLLEVLERRCDERGRLAESIPLTELAREIGHTGEPSALHLALLHLETDRQALRALRFRHDESGALVLADLHLTAERDRRALRPPAAGERR